MTPGWNQLPATNCCSWRRPGQGAEGCLHAQVSFDLVLVASGDALDGFGRSYIDYLMNVCADTLYYFEVDFIYHPATQLQ